MSGMFCYQCEQTAGGKGCQLRGVCGKEPEVATLQDLLLYVTKGLSQYAHRARLLGKTCDEINTVTLEALFTTITNVNFDVERVAAVCRKAAAARDAAQEMYEEVCAEKGVAPEVPAGPAQLVLENALPLMLMQGGTVGVMSRRDQFGDDVAGLQELLTYGMKGAAAYADHAWVLGCKDDEIPAFFHKALCMLADGLTDTNMLLVLVLECGQVNFRTMELLDHANTSHYGHPVPTKVRVTPVKGHAVLVSGHDLKDLETLLKQTENMGINVYTHGEMLPCHGYPELKKYPHLVGNYGGAWQDQQKEFDEFPGAILMTTNCIQKPRDSYKNRIFTTGLVAFPGVAHVSNNDFGPVIAAALEAPGFAADEPEKSITVGFGHNTVMSHAGAIVDAVKSGQLRHFFLIGGCDGAKPGRNYYTELAEKVPHDCVILTLACGKYRFNKLDFGSIGGIPRLLDIGQCNDAYSAIRIALALADAFKCGVNDLPLTLILSWYEQKAVAILLTLLSLGVKNIRLGPTLPAFITPTVLKILVDKFQIGPTTTPEHDLEAALAEK